MIVQKILNNNLLLVENENGQEQIAMGKGLRFSYKVGDALKSEDVEKIYMLKNNKNTKKLYPPVRRSTGRICRSDSECHSACQSAYAGKT